MTPNNRRRFTDEQVIAMYKWYTEEKGRTLQMTCEKFGIGHPSNLQQIFRVRGLTSNRRARNAPTDPDPYSTCMDTIQKALSHILDNPTIAGEMSDDEFSIIQELADRVIELDPYVKFTN